LLRDKKVVGVFVRFRAPSNEVYSRHFTLGDAIPQAGTGTSFPW
jgi:hypothetical protein